jgi:putative MATE family efflux protein
MSSSSVLVESNVKSTLIKMAVPMLAGTFAMNAYNLTDTWFVAQLGTNALAAMGFTFPVVMLLNCVSRGIATGVTSIVSHAIGKQDEDAAKKVLIHSVFLMISICLVLAALGIASMDYVFGQLGAEGDVKTLVDKYMTVWYMGMIFMSLPMLGNGVLMSLGDSNRASMLMIVGTLANLVLDPVFIFGFMGIPAMGIRGAAIATLIAQAIASFWMVSLLARRYKLLYWRTGVLHGYAASVKHIISFAVPGILSMVLAPVSAMLITKLLGSYGYEAVAAAGAASRIEMFAFVVPMALGISLIPFVSQNFGAGRMDRVNEAFRVSSIFALCYGALIAVLFYLASDFFASVFSDDLEVQRILKLYIQIISFGYGMMEVHRYCGCFLIGMHKPGYGTFLNAGRIVLFLLPLSYGGAAYFAIPGIFTGRLLTDLLAGGVGFLWVKGVLNKVETQTGSLDLKI